MAVLSLLPLTQKLSVILGEENVGILLLLDLMVLSSEVQEGHNVKY